MYAPTNTGNIIITIKSTTKVIGVASFNVDIHSNILTISPIGVITLMKNHSAIDTNPRAPRMMKIITTNVSLSIFLLKYDVI